MNDPVISSSIQIFHSALNYYPFNGAAVQIPSTAPDKRVLI